MFKKIIGVLFLGFILLSFGQSFAEDTNNISNQAQDSQDPNDIRSSSFMMDVANLSPATTKYNEGADNIKTLSERIVTFALIVLPTLSLLFMVIGGIMMITSGGSSEKVTKGKNIIIYNIFAIVLALLSYSIIKLILWILGSN